MIAFGGVVVNDVENDLDSSGVQIAHHPLELVHLLASIAAAGVFRFRREETNGVVAPVVCKSAIHQSLVINVGVHRQQLDRAYTQVFQIINRPSAAEGGVSAPQFRRNART